MDPKPLHEGETGAIYDGKVLIREGLSDGKRHLKIGTRNHFDAGDASAQTAPEPLCRGTVKPMLKEEPRLDQNVV